MMKMIISLIRNISKSIKNYHYYDDNDNIMMKSI